MAKWVNTVPQGIAGTGNATIYGVNPVAAQFGNQLAQQRENERQDALLKQQQAEKLAQTYRELDLKTSNGMLWAPGMSAIEKSVIDEGNALKGKGINPWGSSPEALAYRQKIASAQSMQGFRAGHEERAKETSKYIREHLDELDPNDVKASNDWYNNTTLDDAYNKNLAPPEIRKRFNLNNYLSTTKAITKSKEYTKDGVDYKKTEVDKEGTEDSLAGVISRDPRAKAELDKVTNGIDQRDVRGFSDTVEGNIPIILKEIADNKSPYMNQLARDGIEEGTPKFNGFINQLAMARTQTKRNLNSYMAPLVAAASAGVKTEDSQKLNFDQRNYNLKVRNSDRADRTENRQASEASSEASGGIIVAPKSFYGDKVKNKSGVKLPVQETVNFNKWSAVNPTSFGLSQVKSAFNTQSGRNQVLNPDGSTMLTGLGYTKDKSGKYVMGATVSNDGTEYIVFLKDIPADVLKDKNFKAVRAALGAAPTAVNPQTQQPANRTTSLSSIKALVGKKGYEGYTEKELVDYYKSQGFTIK